MAHINSLYDNDLYLIFHLVLGKPPKNLDEWKKQLPLLQVCRKWYNMLYHYVYTWGFIEIYSKGTYDRLPDKIKGDVCLSYKLKGCVYYSNDEIVCLSNLGIITGRNKYNCECVSSVRVSEYEGLSIRLYSPVLMELLNLGVGYWISLTSLYLNLSEDTEFYSDSDKKLPKQIKATATEHILDFTRRAPNITQLNIYWDSSITYYVFPILIRKYAARLQYLGCRNPIQRLPSLHSNELTRLTLNLDNISHQLANMYAKPLQHLELLGLPGDFNWWGFHDHLTPGCIEFTNLDFLTLGYKEQTADEEKRSLKYSKQARPYGSHMLRFPKLSKLELSHCPVDCDVLFTDTLPSHIEQLGIVGKSHSIAAASKLKFTMVDRVGVAVIENHDKLSDDFYKAADYYFGKTLISGNRTLSIERGLDIQRTGSWVNLASIILSELAFDDLLKLIPNLNNLQTLYISTVDIGEEATSIIKRGLEEEAQGRVKQLETKIEHIIIKNLNPDSLRNIIDCLNHLLARMPTVRRFAYLTDNIAYLTDNNYHIISQSFLPRKFPLVRFTDA